MKTKIFPYLIIGLLFLGSGSSFAGLAGHSVTIGTDSGAANAAVSVDMTWDAASQSFFGLAYEIVFDPAILTFTGCTLNEPYASYNLAICRAIPQTTTLIEIGLIDSVVTPGAVPSGVIGTLSFTISATPPFGPTPLVLQNPAVGTNIPLPALNDGSVTVVGPSFFSNPAPDAGVSMGGQITSTVSANVLITNDGAAGTTLTGTCVETMDGDNKFTVTNGSFAVLQGDPGDTVTVSCDSSAVGTFSGVMECPHNGDDVTGPTSTPATYALSCNITPGPQPQFNGVASGLAMVAVEQGDASPTGSLTISNTGDTLSTLSGNCTYTGDTEITVTNQGAYSILQGSPARVLGSSCNTAFEDSYSGTLSCTHNGVNVSSPQDFPVSCSVGPPGDANFTSVPGPGPINLTPTGDSLVDSTPAPSSDLVITNLPLGLTPDNDRDLLLGCAFMTGNDSEITATAAASPLGPSASTTVTFSCDNSVAGSFSATYSCDYDVDGDEEDDGSANYTVSCGVRDPDSDVEESPTAGTPLLILVPQGGTGQTSVFLEETIGEGADATANCGLDDDTFFTILSPSNPINIPSGTTVEVIIEGIDPGPGDISASTTLFCEWTDTQDGDDASWPIEVRVLATDIPAMSDWGRLLMILTLLAIGGVFVRRRVIA